MGVQCRLIGFHNGNRNAKRNSGQMGGEYEEADTDKPSRGLCSCAHGFGAGEPCLADEGRLRRGLQLPLVLPVLLQQARGASTLRVQYGRQGS